MARVMTSVRSGPSRKACYLRFFNCTSRRVSVIWIDYAGYAVTYGTLDPNRHFDIYTYEGHPWIAEDSVTKTRMLLNRVMIFYPSSTDQDQAENNNRELRCYLPLLSNNVNIQNENDALHFWRRQHVYITLPVMTLFERSAEVAAMNIHSRTDVDTLEIPNRLKDVLKSYFQNPWYQ